MANKFLKLKQFRIALQMTKAAINKLYSCKDDMGIYGFEMNRIAMNKKEFFSLCRTLRVEPIIESNYSDYSKYHAHIYYEGIQIYCLYNEPTEYNKYGVKELEKRFKELFFDTENKESAFQKLKKETLEKYEVKYRNKQPIYWMSTYKDFEKYLNRHKREQEPYESRYIKYLEYKNKFEPLDEDTTYSEAERIRPNYDWIVPMTFRQWNKANY